MVEAVVKVAEARSPLWHLALLNPLMARARGLVEDYIIFGAYPSGSAAEAHRAWGERFFPVAPSRPTPSPTREIVHLPELPEALVRAESRSPRAAVQGTVARLGEVLLLGIDASEDRVQ